ncbi:PREDICTED: acylphosphatase-1-like [Ceratosolen solmsi marchali]|uniref:Acylphosphatase n=1 Tax=Ceratosolen solmsi marchali TaxID=326594 RepID=A0AAJ6YIM8_9HYME|nr:PREDICTED: acylphosphatase-1-like [Ceratosolen solmsi marchali]
MIIVDFLKKFEVHSSLILIFLLLIRQYATPEEKMTTIGVNFEVFGKVQGVFFRKFTASKAKELGLNGWCMNTNDGTVRGYIEGNMSKIDEMKNWLQYIGSPKSSILKAEFKNEKGLNNLTYHNFTIKK